MYQCTRAITGSGPTLHGVDIVQEDRSLAGVSMLNISLGFVLIALTVLLGLWDLRWSQGVCLLLWAALLGGRVLLDGTTSMLGTSPSLVAATTLFGIIGIVVFLRRSTSQAGSSGQQGAPQAPCRVGEQRAHAITWHVVALRSRLAAQRALPLWLSRRLWVRAPTPTPMATVSRAQQAKAFMRRYQNTVVRLDDGAYRRALMAGQHQGLRRARS